MRFVCGNSGPPLPRAEQPRSAPDIRARYSKNTDAISRSRLRYFVDFDFLDGEMLVDGARYPVVKMRWADGQRLDRFVQVNLYRPRALLATAAGLLALVKDLERHHIAHGDLQHGNIVLVESGIKLIDYDGMFVRAFTGHEAPEAGLACYQHPRRSASDYGVGHVDVGLRAGSLAVPLPDRPISQNPTPRHGYWWLRASADAQGSPPPETLARESLRVRAREFLRRTYRIRVRLRTRSDSVRRAKALAEH